MQHSKVFRKYFNFNIIETIHKISKVSSSETHIYTLVCVPQQKVNPNSSSIGGERISRLYELGSEPERRFWVERYLTFMEERGTPVSQLPVVGKKPLDLWKLYVAVREIGGLAMVIHSKQTYSRNCGIILETGLLIPLVYIGFCVFCTLAKCHVK